VPSPTRKESLSGFVERMMGGKPVKPRYAQMREELKRKKKA
jgi:hypothetical protein